MMMSLARRVRLRPTLPWVNHANRRARRPSQCPSLFRQQPQVPRLRLVREQVAVVAAVGVGADLGSGRQRVRRRRHKKLRQR